VDWASQLLEEMMTMVWTSFCKLSKDLLIFMLLTKFLMAVLMLGLLLLTALPGVMANYERGMC